MQRVNILGVETRRGYRTFELYHGDLTQMGCKVDVLIISAFKEGYESLPGTVIGALGSRLRVNVRQLSEQPALDLREALGLWISKPVPKCEFTRILCIEIRGGAISLNEALENAFAGLSLLEAKGIRVGRVALPILGAGHQQLDADEVMPLLLKHAHAYLSRSEGLESILFVEIDAEKVARLDTAMNVALGRSKVFLPKGQVIAGIRSELTALIERSHSLFHSDESRVLDELRATISRDDARSFELGVVARRFAERVCASVLGDSAKAEKLEGRIRELGHHQVATWIQEYLHVLRVVGNESAHETTKPGRRPREISEADLAICLMCFERALEFWSSWKEQQAASAS